jgi:hypothetical protein
MNTGIVAAMPQSVSCIMWKLCAAAKSAARLERDESNAVFFTGKLDARKVRKAVLGNRKGEAYSSSWKTYLASRQIHDVAAALASSIFFSSSGMAFKSYTAGSDLNTQLERPALFRHSSLQLPSDACAGKRSPAIPVRTDEASRPRTSQRTNQPETFGTAA